MTLFGAVLISASGIFCVWVLRQNRKLAVRLHLAEYVIGSDSMSQEYYERVLRHQGLKR